MPADKSAMKCGVFHTSLGWMAAVWNGDRLAALSFGRQSPAEAAGAVSAAGNAEIVSDFPLGSPQRRLQERLTRFADGEADDFLDVPLAEEGFSEFRRQVVNHCRRIPPGEVLTYAELAALAGSPGAARAVGNIMASNRFPLIVPCHRVVGAGGSLGGYSAPDGLATKKRLLESEGALGSIGRPAALAGA